MMASAEDEDIALADRHALRRFDSLQLGGGSRLRRVRATARHAMAGGTSNNTPRPVMPVA